MGLLLKRALDHAATWHRDQRRRYPGADVPYISHLAGVAAILARHGFDEEVVAAGMLHDCIEDAGVTYEQLVTSFTERVADLVRHLTEPDKSLPWDERKRRYLEHFAESPWEAQAITLADKIDNFESIIVCALHHGDPWSQFKRGRDAQLAHFDGLSARLRGLAPHPLIDEYERTLRELRAF